MKATIGDIVGRLLEGALVLLVVFALSWIVINHNVEERVHEGSAVKEPKSAVYGMVDGEREGQVNEDDKAQNLLTDWESAHAAAESGDLAKLRLLILERGVHVDAEDKHSMTLLQAASRHGHLEIVQFLMANHAAVNATELDDRAALHFAVVRGHVSIARFLLEHGADVNLRKRLGLTPMHVVAQSSNTDLVQVLLEYGADMEAPDDRGDTPLDWAITFGSGIMVQTLLDQGAILRSRDADGKRPMDRAAKGWDVLKVDALAKKGQPFPRNQRDMQRVMMLYAMNKGQMKDEGKESSSGA